MHRKLETRMPEAAACEGRRVRVRVCQVELWRRCFWRPPVWRGLPVWHDALARLGRSREVPAEDVPSQMRRVLRALALAILVPLSATI